MEQVSDDAPEFPALSNKNAVITGLTSGAWGWLPVLSCTSAIGLFLVALAYNAGRFAEQWAEPLFWFGLVVIFLPIAVRLFSQQPTRRERITLLIIMAISLYFVKFLQYPLYFAYYDGFHMCKPLKYCCIWTSLLFKPNLTNQFLLPRT